MKQLVADARKLMPHIPFTADFAWAGVFGNTRDGLGYMGKIPGMANCHAILGCGGNGIVFSMIGARIIADELTGEPNSFAAIFAFER